MTGRSEGPLPSKASPLGGQRTAKPGSVGGVMSQATFCEAKGRSRASRAPSGGSGPGEAGERGGVMFATN